MKQSLGMSIAVFDVFLNSFAMVPCEGGRDGTFWVDAKRRREEEEKERRRLEEEMQQQEATKKLSSIEERPTEQEEAGSMGKRKREPEVTVGTSRKSARIAGRKPRRGAS